MNSFSATQLPTYLLLASFVITFLTTRLVTRLIRSGKGPFKDNVTEGGVHVHHAIYGIGILLVGVCINTAAAAPLFRCFGGIAIGAGASLILDEFALILHLRDVYWANEGRASVQATALAGACLMLMALGFGPVSSEDFRGGTGNSVIVALILLSALIALWVAARKGKYRLVLLSIFVWPLAYVAAIRLARPGSPWFTKRYAVDGRKYKRAIKRAERSDQRWGGRWIRFANAIAGAPTPDEQAAHEVLTTPGQ